MQYYTSLTDRLYSSLQLPLPGLEAQLKMAPPNRREAQYQIPENVKHSAVLALIYPYAGDQLYVVFMKRADDGRVHSGQISLPGGKWEESDPDYVYTALREAEEEIGVPMSQVQVLGQLSELYIPVSNYLVYPIVGFVGGRPRFVPDAKEVAEIIEVPVKRLLQEEIQGIHSVAASSGFRIKAPAYKIDQHIIWGATAMIVAELTEILAKV